MHCQRPTLLLASLLLLLVAGGANAFMIVFEEGSGESTLASARAFSASSPFLLDDFTSALEPLFHPVSWLEQQLQEVDALQQAALENLLIEQMAGLGLRDVDMQPQELESEMLHKVGCQRFAPAMHEQALFVDPNPWDADDWTDVDLPVTQGDDAGSRTELGTDDQAEPSADFYAQEQAASYINSYLQQTARGFDDDQAGVYTEGGEGLREEDAAALSAWLEDLSEAGAKAGEGEGVREDAATLAAWFDDINADARSDDVDLLTLSAYTHGAEADKSDSAMAAAAAVAAAVVGSMQQQRGSQGQGQGQDLPLAAFTLLPLRGAASEQGWPQPGEQEERMRSSEIFSDPLMVQADAGLFLQEDEVDDLFAWPEQDQDPGMLRHNVYARMLDQLLMLRSLFWPLVSQRMQGAGSGFRGGAGSGAFLSWYDEPLLVPEHFTEEDLAAGLTIEAGGRQGDGRYGSANDAATWGAGARAAAGTATATAAAAASIGSYWLDLNNDGLPDVKLAKREAGTAAEGDRVPLSGGVEVTEGAWRRFLLAVLLTATAAMAAFFVRALLQLRDAMAANAGGDGASLGQAGHVLVPVTLERDGRLVHGLMLLPEEEADVMGALEQGKGTLVGEWQTDGKGCKAGDGAVAGKGQLEADGWTATSCPAQEREHAGAAGLTEPLLQQHEGCEDEEAAEGIIVAAHFAAQAQRTRRP